MGIKYITLNEFRNHDGNYRFIYTGVTDKCHGEILRSVEGQLSDGYWENSTAMEKYWKNEYVIFDDERNEFVIAVTADQGKWKLEPYRYSYREQRMLKRNKWCENPFYKMTDEKILNWFATKIKQIVKAEEKDNNGSNWWTKSPDRELAYLGYHFIIKVQDCKDICKILKGGC